MRREKKLMKKNEIPVIILKSRTGYAAHSPLVLGCIATGKTIDQTLQTFRSAVEFHLEGERLFLKTSKKSLRSALRASFDDYGTEAIYATIVVAA